MNKRFQFIWLLALAILLAPAAFADTIEATVVNVLRYGQVDVSLDGGATWDNGNYAGSISMTRVGGSSSIELTPDSTNFVVFCIEPREPISAGVIYTWEVKGLSHGTSSIGGIGVSKANQLRELMAEVHPILGASLTHARALALQIAIWEIVEEASGTLNVSNGSARFRNATRAKALTLAQGWLDNVNGDVPANSLLLAMWNDGQQDLLIQTTPGTFQDLDTPEPATLSVLGVSLLGFGLFRRRQAKAKYPAV